MGTSAVEVGFQCRLAYDDAGKVDEAYIRQGKAMYAGNYIGGILPEGAGSGGWVKSPTTSGEVWLKVQLDKDAKYMGSYLSAVGGVTDPVKLGEEDRQTPYEYFPPCHHRRRQGCAASDGNGVFTVRSRNLRPKRNHDQDLHFTYAGDAQEAVACVRCARTALPGALVTVADDSAFPVPEEVRRAFLAYGARYKRTDFPRNGNLNGPECVRGIISTLAGDAADDDIIVKIDSDTALLSGEWVRNMHGVGLDWYACGCGARRFFGLCYAMSGKQPDWPARPWSMQPCRKTPRKILPLDGRSLTCAVWNGGILPLPGHP